MIPDSTLGLDKVDNTYTNKQGYKQKSSRIVCSSTSFTDNKHGITSKQVGDPVTYTCIIYKNISVLLHKMD